LSFKTVSDPAPNAAMLGDHAARPIPIAVDR
jgi:hypothetical protein